MSDQPPLLFLTLFPLPFVGLGVLALRAAREDLALCVNSRRWPAATGTVESMTRIHHGTYGDGASGPRLRSQFYVRYFYDVAGKRHWGAWKTSPARSVERATALAGVSEGGPMVIYVCPGNPSVSVVERGWTFGRTWVAACGVVFLVAPATLCWTWLAFLLLR